MSKNPAAVALGKKGGKARAEKTSKERLTEIGKKGAQKRWGDKKNPQQILDEGLKEIQRVLGDRFRPINSGATNDLLNDITTLYNRGVEAGRNEAVEWKELKDAGFPQKGSWEDPEQHKYWSTYDGGASKKRPEIITSDEANFGFMEDLCYIPILSELIEACGGQFDALETLGGEKKWSARGGGEEEHADSAIEAVARLWLALNPTP